MNDSSLLVEYDALQPGADRSAVVATASTTVAPVIVVLGIVVPAVVATTIVAPTTAATTSVVSIKRALRQVKYPKSAVRRGQQGTVVLELTINRSVYGIVSACVKWVDVHG